MKKVINVLIILFSFSLMYFFFKHYDNKKWNSRYTYLNELSSQSGYQIIKITGKTTHDFLRDSSTDFFWVSTIENKKVTYSDRPEEFYHDYQEWVKINSDGKILDTHDFYNDTTFY